MQKILYLLICMLALCFHSQIVYSKTSDVGQKIELYESSGFGRDKGETHHPHRSPVIQPTPTAYWNTTNSVVTMETSGRLVTSLNYVITKSNGEVVISGTCISKPDEPVTITLPALAIGKYTLNITIGIITYTGNFYVF